MNGTSQTYLRLFEPDGSWIERPDYMVLAALADPDPSIMEHIHASMLKEDAINQYADGESLTRFGEDIKARNLERRVERRLCAGSVVLELCRLARATGKPPRVSAAQRLVGYHRHQVRKYSLEETALRQVKDYWSEFLNTSHLQAAAVYDPSLIEQMEGDEGATLKFLGLARAFETFVDANVVSNHFKWSPIRIPKEIEAASKIEFIPLSNQELNEAGVT